MLSFKEMASGLRWTESRKTIGKRSLRTEAGSSGNQKRQLRSKVKKEMVQGTEPDSVLTGVGKRETGRCLPLSGILLW